MSQEAEAPTKLEKIEHASARVVDSFTSNARRAMKDNPSYFVWWYTAKSIALVAAIGTAAYYAGKSRGMALAQTQITTALARGQYR